MEKAERKTGSTAHQMKMFWNSKNLRYLFVYSSTQCDVVKYTTLATLIVLSKNGLSSGVTL